MRMEGQERSAEGDLCEVGVHESAGEVASEGEFFRDRDDADCARVRHVSQKTRWDGSVGVGRKVGSWRCG